MSAESKRRNAKGTVRKKGAHRAPHAAADTRTHAGSQPQPAPPREAPQQTGNATRTAKRCATNQGGVDVVLGACGLEVRPRAMHQREHGLPYNEDGPQFGALNLVLNLLKDAGTKSRSTLDQWWSRAEAARFATLVGRTCGEASENPANSKAFTRSVDVFLALAYVNGHNVLPRQV